MGGLDLSICVRVHILVGSIFFFAPKLFFPRDIPLPVVSLSMSEAYMCSMYVKNACALDVGNAMAYFVDNAYSSI